MTESKRKKQVRRWKHLKERYNKLYRSLKEDEDLSTRRKHLPSAGEIIDLEADGSIDRDQAIGKLKGRGYADEAAAKMVDNYNSAEELEESAYKLRYKLQEGLGSFLKTLRAKGSIKILTKMMQGLDVEPTSEEEVYNFLEKQLPEESEENRRKVAKIIVYMAQGDSYKEAVAQAKEEIGSGELEESAYDPWEEPYHPLRARIQNYVPPAELKELEDALNRRSIIPYEAIEILMDHPYNVPPKLATTFVEEVGIGRDPLQGDSPLDDSIIESSWSSAPSATAAETKVNEMVPRDTQAYYRDAVYTGEMIPLEVITDLELDYGVPDWAAEEWVTAVTGDS